MKKVLLLEQISNTARQAFEEAGYGVESFSHAMDEDDLIAALQDINILGIRSKTKITEKVLLASPTLQAIGAFCIGTNQIQLDACTKKGVAVFNAPSSSTNSVAELAIAEMIMLQRQIPQKNSAMHNGKWDKSLALSKEVMGKTLGIIGYGNIGQRVSQFAEMFGMKILYFDIEKKNPVGLAIRVETMEELLARADIVTLHIDGRAENEKLIGKKEFDLMKQDALFINLSRGFVIDVDALVEALEQKKVAGVALDVFPVEPKTREADFETRLAAFDNVILTPHIGGNTHEAQERIGMFVSEQIIGYVNSGITACAVNIPQLNPGEIIKKRRRVCHMHANKPGVLDHISKILADNGINILAETLKTNETVGYLVLDTQQDIEGDISEKLSQLPDTYVSTVV